MTIKYSNMSNKQTRFVLIVQEFYKIKIFPNMRKYITALVCIASVSSCWLEMYLC